MTRYTPVPFALITFALLAALAAAFVARQNLVFEILAWAPSESWKTVFSLQWDPEAAALSLLTLVGAVGFTGWGLRSGKLFETKRQLVFFSTALLALLVSICARSAVILLAGWGVWVVASFALFQRDETREGGGVAWYRWKPLLFSLLSLFLAVVCTSAVFHTTDLREMRRLALEPYEYSPELMATAWIAALTAGLLSAWVPVVAGFDKKDCSLLEDWWRLTSLFAAPLIPLRFGFLALHQPGIEKGVTLTVLIVSALGAFAAWTTHTRRPRWHWTAFTLSGLTTLLAVQLWAESTSIWFFSAIGLLALYCFAAWWAPKIDLTLPKRKGRSPIRLTRKISSTLQNGLDRLEVDLWPQIWRIPPQACRTLGTFFVFWQSGTPQYAIVLILFGTLLLFWAALKTQVMW